MLPRAVGATEHQRILEPAKGALELEAGGEGGALGPGVRDTDRAARPRNLQR